MAGVRVAEHVVNLADGTAVDQDFEGVQPEGTARAELAEQARKEEALERLRHYAIGMRGEVETPLSCAMASDIIDSFLELLGHGDAQA